jgi:hypothetical protein
MLEPKDLLLANEHLRRSNRMWKALALAECTLLLLVTLFGFVAASRARMRAVAALRAERDARVMAVQAERKAAQAASPVTPAR